MRVEAHQGGIACKIIIGGIDTKMGIGDGGTRHVNKVNDLLEIGGRMIGSNVVNGGNWMGGGKAKCTAYLTKGINESHDEGSNHVIINKRLETDQRTIIERTIGNQSKTDHRKNDRKPIIP